jgi:hypothetical protein
VISWFPSSSSSSSSSNFTFECNFYRYTEELKFNCFFLMPLMNEFAGFLRQEMETAFESNLDGVFDVRSVRMALEERQRKLESELGQMEHIQEKFSQIHNQLEVGLCTS